MIFTENNNIQSIPILSPKKEQNEQKNRSNSNKFGYGNIFYNGDIKSMKLIGPPSKDNRVGKMLFHDKFDKGTFSLDDLKVHIKENDKASYYLNFVDKSKMNENDLINFYKGRRRELTETYDEIAKRQSAHINKLFHNTLNSKVSKGSFKDKSSIINANSTTKSTSSQYAITSSDLGNKYIPTSASQFDILQALFPYSKSEYFPIKSNSNILGNGLINELINDNESKSNEKIKINNFHKNKSSSNLNNRPEESKEEMHSRPTETIRASTPYDTEENIRSKEFRESKTKWVSKREFKRFFGNSKSNSFNPIVMNHSQYVSPNSHTFRKNEKEKWINKKNFLVN